MNNHSMISNFALPCFLLLYVKTYPTVLMLQLAFQSLGVVFGDLGTSPLYVFYNIFPEKIEDTEQIISSLLPPPP